MPSKFRLRPIFAPFVKFLARGAIHLHITPNLATWLMLGCAFMAGLGLILWQNLLWFGIWVFITGLMDGVDGAIARLTERGSAFGAFFDSTMDRVSEGVIYLTLLLSTPDLFIFSEKWTTIFIGEAFVSSVLISYTRARIELIKSQQKIKCDTNVGLMGRSERLFALFLLSVGSAPFLTSAYDIFSWSFVLFANLCLSTAIFRMFSYKKQLSDETTK